MDDYRLDVPGPARLGVIFRAAALCGEGRLTTLAPDGSQVGEPIADRCSEARSAVITLPTAGSYVLRVNATGNDSGEYDLGLYDVTKPVTLAAPAWPPAQSCKAVPMPLADMPVDAAFKRDQTCPYVEAALAVPGERDAYRITVAGPARIGVVFAASSLCGEGRLTTYAPDGSQVGQPIADRCSEAQRGVVLLPAPGTYTMEVAATEADYGAYTLELYDVSSALLTDAAPWPPAQSCTTRPLALAQMPVDATYQRDRTCPYVAATISVPGEVDNYVITTSRPTTVGVIFTASALCGEGRVTAFAPDGSVLGQPIKDRCSEKQSGTLTLGDAGTYTIQVAATGTDTGPYTLELLDVTA